MNIESINPKILGLTELAKQNESKAQNKVSVTTTDSLDQVLNLSIQRVLSSNPPADTVDISQIRRELESGLYDSPETIRAAAKQIAQLGI